MSGSLKLAIVNAIVTLMAYLCYFLLEGKCSMAITPVLLIAFLLYLISALNSVFFWILKSKINTYAFLPLAINVLLVALVYVLPSVRYSKQYPKGSYALNGRKKCKCSEGLYLEYYTISGGRYMAGDVNAIYLTDKSNFRVFLGCYGDYDENIDIDCHGDNIIVKKESSTGIDTNWTPPILLTRQVFTLTELRLKHIYD